MEIVAPDSPLDAWRRFLKTGLLAAPPADLDRLENRAIAGGIRGELWWGDARWPARRGSERREVRETEAERDARRKLLDPLRPWKALAAGVRPARDWARGLRGALDACGVPERIEARARAVEASDPERADEDRQVLADFEVLLGELESTIGEEGMALSEFGRILDSGLESFDIGIAPPTVDQVLVGSIERSRHPEIRALLVVGFGQDLFPRVRAEDIVLDDADRAMLDRAGLDVGSTSTSELLDERLLAYILFTRPSERIWLSFPTADEKGRELAPSPYLDDLRSLFPDLAIRSERELQPLDRATTPLRTAALLAARIREKQADLEPPLRAVYERARRMCRRPLRAAFASLAYRNLARLPKRERVKGEVLATSVSAIETFAECPFRHFAQYVLKVEERETHEIRTIDLGNLEHDILERFVARAIEDGELVYAIEPADVRRRIEEIADERADLIAGEGIFATPRGRALRARTIRRLERVIALLRRFYLRARISPGRVEVGFGRSAGLPALEIETPKGAILRLSGRIDRLDGDPATGLAFVFDYKLGSDKRLSMAEIYGGLTLALPTYLVAVRELRLGPWKPRARPGGAFLQSLTRKIPGVKDSKELERIRARAMEEGDLLPLRPRGVFDADVVGALDSALQPGERSPVIAAARKKDGALGYDETCDHVASEDLDRILAYARRKLGEFADAILDGEIRVRPYVLGGKTPCTTCEYGGFCRFEKERERWKYRRLEVYRKGEALARIAEALEGPERPRADPEQAEG